MEKINFQNGVTKVNADTFTTFQNNIEKAINEHVGDTIPIGSIISYPKAVAPENWLICDGSAVSRTDY